MANADRITRLNAALEGRYRVEHELGEGGMATVYLAEDLRHERRVALKVLKRELAAVVGAERFLAEIKTTANLQHPHILPLFDSGEADGFLFFVMPYVGGESLRDRLDREHQLPVDDAVRIATNLAEALDYAHRQGVVHRDIKPANVLLQDGKPVIADFGVAFAVSAGGGDRLTETGLSLGTPHYMSPEQATGDQSVGPATDIYALGCVLYEMLVGEPPYTGSTPQAVLGRIITADVPRISAERKSVPPNVEATVFRALEKIPADRFRGAVDFARALSDEGFSFARRTALKGAPDVRRAAGAVTAARSRIAAALVGGVVVGGLATWAWLRPEVPGGLPPAVFAMDMDGIDVSEGADVVVSRDGSRFVVAGMRDGVRAIYWRSAEDERFQMVPGTEDSQAPTISPEGDWIAYQDWGTMELMRVSLAGGAPQPLYSGDHTPWSPHWGDDGTIVFDDWGSSTGSNRRGIYQVPASGGVPVLVWESESILDNAHLLPGGRSVLWWSRADSSTYLYEIGADSARLLIPGRGDATYVEGHVLSVDAAGTLWAVPFDLDRGELSGEAFPVVDGLAGLGLYRSYSVSDNGVLVYHSGGPVHDAPRELVVVGLDGSEEALSVPPGAYGEPRWSPDGRSIAYRGRVGEQEFDLFVFDAEAGTPPRRLTFIDAGVTKAWSPDGSQIAFSAVQEGKERGDIFVQTVDDDAPPRLLLEVPGSQFLSHWPEGIGPVFEHLDTAGGRSIGYFELTDPPEVRTYLGNESDALYMDMWVSPRGDLAAYVVQTRPGRELQIRSFPEPGQPQVVHAGRTGSHQWSPDGNTLYYWNSSFVEPDTLFAARIQRGATFSVASTDVVLTGSYDEWRNWHLHPDGDRFVVTRPIVTDEARTRVMVNFFEELRRRAGN